MLALSDWAIDRCLEFSHGQPFKIARVEATASEVATALASASSSWTCFDIFSKGLLQLIIGMFFVILQRPVAPLLMVDLPVQVRNLDLSQCIFFGEEPRRTCYIGFNS